MTSSMTPAGLVLEAARFAAEKHRGQRRDDQEASPYINHPLAVAHALHEAGVTDPEVLSAALLHDTVEDTETTLEELAQRFGRTISDLVAEVTDDKSLPKATRKELQVSHAAAATDAAKQIKIADKISNISDIADAPPADWSPDRKVEYLNWADRVVAGCRGVNEALDGLYDETVARARRALGLEP